MEKVIFISTNSLQTGEILSSSILSSSKPAIRRFFMIFGTTRLVDRPRDAITLREKRVRRIYFDHGSWRYDFISVQL